MPDQLGRPNCAERLNGPESVRHVLYGSVRVDKIDIAEPFGRFINAFEKPEPVRREFFGAPHHGRRLDNRPSDFWRLPAGGLVVNAGASAEIDDRSDTINQWPRLTVSFVVHCLEENRFNQFRVLIPFNDFPGLKQPASYSLDDVHKGKAPAHLLIGYPAVSQSDIFGNNSDYRLPRT
ncbi:hypothetical protein XI04_32835 [Bradyrhizobium sp. CCBAU 11430]|nr:hypothetical protein [Bradyrhizobium sp. CCBAU 21360]MDA9458526.1 hypothetical protein [Bradyrhizobium sp. CCBAU 21359]MDA9517795.1 hypothetical protein [Bradyrhizobium sp. CCBAU 11430]